MNYLECQNLIMSGHAVRRMFERKISVDDIKEVLRDGVAIENYPDEKPLPCRLILGRSGGKAIHVVIAIDATEKKCHIITVYVPDPAIWNDNFTVRRPK